MAYNDLIVIQQNTVSRDTAGFKQFSWSTYKTVWAEIVDTGGVMDYESEQPVWRDSKTFKIHKHDAPEVKAYPQMRISYNSDYFMITGIEHEGRLFTTLTGDATDDD